MQLNTDIPKNHLEIFIAFWQLTCLTVYLFILAQVKTDDLLVRWLKCCSFWNVLMNKNTTGNINMVCLCTAVGLWHFNGIFFFIFPKLNQIPKMKWMHEIRKIQLENLYSVEHNTVFIIRCLFVFLFVFFGKSFAVRILWIAVYIRKQNLT